MENLSLKEWSIITGISGGLAGILVDTIFFPLDTMKTFLQSTCKRGTKISLRDFYNGFAIQVGVSGPACAFYFLGYEAGKSLFQKVTGVHHSVS